MASPPNTPGCRHPDPRRGEGSWTDVIPHCHPGLVPGSPFLTRTFFISLLRVAFRTLLQTARSLACEEPPVSHSLSPTRHACAVPLLAHDDHFVRVFASRNSGFILNRLERLGAGLVVLHAAEIIFKPFYVSRFIIYYVCPQLNRIRCCRVFFRPNPESSHTTNLPINASLIGISTTAQ